MLYLATVQAVAHGTRHILDAMTRERVRDRDRANHRWRRQESDLLREHADITGEKSSFQKSPRLCSSARPCSERRCRGLRHGDRSDDKNERRRHGYRTPPGSGSEIPRLQTRGFPPDVRRSNAIQRDHEPKIVGDRFRAFREILFSATARSAWDPDPIQVMQGMSLPPLRPSCGAEV